MYPSYDAEVLRSKGLMITEDTELGLAIVRYHKSDNDWKNKQFGECNREDPIVRIHRSVIYSLDSKCTVHASTQRRKSESSVVLDALKEENWVVTPYIDGTMISVFWHSAKDCWVISTRSKFHAVNNYMSPQPFRDLFVEGIQSTFPGDVKTIQDFVPTLDGIGREYSYTFVLCHPENKHVIIANEPKVYLVQVSKCTPFTNESSEIKTRWEPMEYDEMVNVAKKMCVHYPEHIVIPEDQTLGEYCRSVIASDKTEGVMLVPSLMNTCVERIRILSNAYDNALKLRGNTPSSRTNIIRVWGEDPTGDLLRDYEGYFPDETEEVHSVVKVLYESANELELYYKNRHVRKSMEHGNLPHWSRKPIWDLHGIYLRERVPIRKERILEYYRTKPAAFVNKVLKTREKENKRDQEKEKLNHANNNDV
jgi:hypothetical protein